LDVEGKGELNISDLKFINEQLKYNYNEDQLWEIIHSVGGFNADTITFEKFNSFIKRKVEKRRLL
jgi:Ca2+-binding EF-hand superfamily protein